MGILQRRNSDYENSDQNFDKAEQLFDLQSNDEAIAEVKLQRGVSFNVQEKTDLSRSQFEQVINMPRANPYQKIRAMLQISSICAGEGKFDCAESYAVNAVNLAKNERMENLATNGLIDLGNSYLARGVYDKAEQNFQQALELARKDEGFRNEARALLALGSLKIQQKNPEEAKNFTNQSISFFQNGNYFKELDQANLIIGRANEIEGNFDIAISVFQKVENSSSASDADQAYAKMLIGNVLLKKENYPAALQRFEKSLEIYKKLNSSFYAAYSLFYLSETLVNLGRFEEAQNRLEEIKNNLKENDPLLSQYEIKKHIINAKISLKKENFTEAAKEIKMIDLSKDNSSAYIVESVLCAAQTSLMNKDLKVLQSCNNAISIAEKNNDAYSYNYARLLLSKAYLAAGNYNKALETAVSAKEYFAGKNSYESAWIACLIAAQASIQLKQTSNAKEFNEKTQEMLNLLKNDWGEEVFNKYLLIPEINSLYKHSENLLLKS